MRAHPQTACVMQDSTTTVCSKTMAQVRRCAPGTRTTLPQTCATVQPGGEITEFARQDLVKVQPRILWFAPNRHGFHKKGAVRHQVFNTRLLYFAERGPHPESLPRARLGILGAQEDGNKSLPLPSPSASLNIIRRSCSRLAASGDAAAAAAAASRARLQ